MNHLMKFLTGLLLSISVSASAQEPQHDSLQPENIQALVTSLRRDIAELALLSESIADADSIDRDALVFRRDVRSFRILKDFETLVTRIATAPDTAPYKNDIVAQLTELSVKAGEAILARITEIEKRVSDAESELGSSSGMSRVEQRAFFQNLEDIRVRYYETLLSLIKSRNKLNLASDDLRAHLGLRSILFAEALAGRVQLSAAARAQIVERAKQVPNDADVKAALVDLDLARKRNLQRLETMTLVIDGLEMDSAKYKTVLLQQSGSLSVNLFSSQALFTALSEAWVSAKFAVKSSGPDLLVHVLIFAAVLFLFRILARVTRRLVSSASDRSSMHMSTLLKNMLVSISGGAVMAIGILIALSYVGISLTPMLAGLGVAGFIVGFALQDSLSNFAAGAMILIYRPYDVNDFIEVTGASGLVKKMNLVSTTILTFDNQTLVVPNSKIWGDVIKNVTAQNKRRVDLQFGIGYGDDIELAERIFTEIVTAHEKVLKNPEPTIRVHSLGDSSVNFIVRPWTLTEDYWNVYWDITREVKLRLDREGISIPFPQRDVHLYTDKDD